MATMDKQEENNKELFMGTIEKGHSHKTLLKNDALYQYMLETSVYPLEPESLRELRQITSGHPDNGMATAADEVQFLGMLIKLINAKNTMEIGVFTGYSLLATALALPHDGKILAIDFDCEAYELGLPIIQKAGVEHKIDFHEGQALHILDQIMEDDKYRGWFDFVFVDADKCNYVNYHQRLLELVKVGGLIAYDNTLWSGSLVEPPETALPDYIQKSKKYVLDFNKYAVDDPRVEVCQLSIADGLTLCRRRY